MFKRIQYSQENLRSEICFVHISPVKHERKNVSNILAGVYIKHTREGKRVKRREVGGLKRDRVIQKQKMSSSEGKMQGDIK